MATPASPISSIVDAAQVIRIHGPYEDAIISTNELLAKLIDGQDAATKKEIWSRYLEFTKPLHDLATQAANQIAEWLKSLGK